MAKNSQLKPRVGIFIPCYNLGPYISEALESLYKQTFQDFEVIIADDASPDQATIATLKSLDLPDNYQIFFEKRNLGMNRITNKYAKKLPNEYFLMLSSDDKLAPKYLEKTVKFLDNNPEIHAVTPWLKYFGGAKGYRKYKQSKTDLRSMLQQNNFSGSALMRKSTWDDLGGYDEAEIFRRHQDYDLWLSLLERGYKLGVIEEPLFYYRILKTSLSHDLDPDWEKDWMFNLINKHYTSYNKYFPEIVSEYYRQVIKSNNAWQQLSDGHRWLDDEYRKNLKTLETITAEVELLRQEVEKMRAYSLYPILRKIKRSLTK